jgi:hypothetical protein
MQFFPDHIILDASVFSQVELLKINEMVGEICRAQLGEHSPFLIGGVRG